MKEISTKQLQLGDKVTMKKEHPCGGHEWEIVRLGADVKLKCLTCSHIVLVSRDKFDRLRKNVVMHTENTALR